MQTALITEWLYLTIRRVLLFFIFVVLASSLRAEEGFLDNQTLSVDYDSTFSTSRGLYYTAGKTSIRRPTPETELDVGGDVKFYKSLTFTPIELLNSGAVNWTMSNKYHITVTQSSAVTLTFTDPPHINSASAQYAYNLVLVVDYQADSPQPVVWPVGGTVRWAGTTPVLTATKGERHLFFIQYRTDTDSYYVASTITN